VSQRSATVMAMGHLLGYGRVSATDQQPHLQVDALERAAATGFYRDHRRGPYPPPHLEHVLDQLRPADLSAGRTASAAGAVSACPAVAAAR
jgi:hypothetical protein